MCSVAIRSCFSCFILRDQDNVEVRAVLCAFQAVEKVFAVPEGFYWQTVESDDKRFPDSSATEACRDTDTEVKNNKRPPPSSLGG